MTTNHSPYLHWVGMNTQPDTSPEELAKFNDYYSHTFLPEVLAQQFGFTAGVRYELVEPDPRGDFGPQWLAIYQMKDEDAVKAFIARADGPPQERPKYTPGPEAFKNNIPWWHMIWRPIAPASGDITSGDAPYIYIVGMNVPQGTDEAGMREFDEFYTNIHVPEVVAVSKFSAGVRYELYREFDRWAPPGSPQFMALYEGDEESRRVRAERAANPAAATSLSSGPLTWEARDTRWRLLYKRIDP